MYRMIRITKIMIVKRTIKSQPPFVPHMKRFSNKKRTFVCLHNRFPSQANNKKRTNQIIDSNVTIDQIQIASKQMNMQ